MKIVGFSYFAWRDKFWIFVNEFDFALDFNNQWTDYPKFHIIVGLGCRARFIVSSKKCQVLISLALFAICFLNSEYTFFHRHFNQMLEFSNLEKLIIIFHSDEYKRRVTSSNLLYNKGFQL